MSAALYEAAYGVALGGVLPVTLAIALALTARWARGGRRG